MAAKKPEENLHKDHRKRMRARFDKEGFASFADHNILEYLLFFSIARGDTNPTAHKLMNEFHSLYNVLTADPEELQKVNGVGPASANLIRSVFEAGREMKIRKISEHPILRYEQLIMLATEWYGGRAEETVAIMLLDDKRSLIDIVEIAREHRIVPASYLDRILEVCEARNAAQLVLMHNHADGIMHASDDDLYLTGNLYKELSEKGVTLLEHLIVHEFDVISILDESVGKPISGYAKIYY